MPRHLLVSFSLLSTVACASRIPDRVGRILESQVSARGGAHALGAVHALEMQLQIDEPTFSVRGTYLVNRDGCMRIDVFDGDRYVLSEGLDHAGGYQHRRGDTTYGAQSDRGTLTLRHGIESPLRLFSLAELASRGHRVEAEGRETLDGARHDRVRLRYTDGFESELWLDSATHLIIRVRERKPMHLDVDSTALPIETQVSDYRTVDGVQFPFATREINLSTGAELGHTTVRSLVANSRAARDVCTRPTLPRQ